MIEFYRRRKIVIITACAIVFGVTIWGIFREFRARPSLPQQRKALSVRFAIAKAVLTAPVFIAHEQGFFSEAGLDVKMDDGFSSGKTAFEAMLAGKADISTVATTPAVFHRFQRQDFSLLVTYTTSSDGVKIITRKDAGIEDAFSLKGKTIGVVPGTISHFLTISFLAYHKILLDEVRLAEFKASELPDALDSHKVDAIAVWEPHAARALQQLKGNGVRIPTSNVYRQAIMLAVRNDFAEQHPEALERIIRGLQKAMEMIAEQRVATQRFVAQSLELDREFVAGIWDDFSFQLSLDQLLLITMEEEARWAIRFGYTTATEVPNYLPMLYPDALLAVKPEAVTVILDKQSSEE